MTKQERISLMLAEVKHARNHLLEAGTYAVYYDFTEEEIEKLSETISKMNRLDNELIELAKKLREYMQRGGF